MYAPEVKPLYISLNVSINRPSFENLRGVGKLGSTIFTKILYEISCAIRPDINITISYSTRSLMGKIYCTSKLSQGKFPFELNLCH